MMNCKKCGEKLTEGAAFCHKCGAAVSKSGSERRAEFADTLGRASLNAAKGIASVPITGA